MNIGKYKIGHKVITKNKLLKQTNNQLKDEILELKIKLSNLEKGKESLELLKRRMNY